MIISSTHLIKRLTDGKILQCRCCQIPNEKDFDIVWQVFENDKWKDVKKIPNTLYSFYVPEDEKPNQQTEMLFN